MIKVFYGENRVAALEAAREFLGGAYEVVEGADLTEADLPSLLLGGSLFTTERAILIRDLADDKRVFEKLGDYLTTPYKVAVLETKIDKRAGVYKALKDQIEWREFKMPKDAKAGIVFEIYRTAKRDGKKAVKMLREVEDEQEPLMFVGLMVSQAVKDYSARPGMKEKAALRGLSKLDMNLKSTKIDAWTLIEAYLLQLS